MSHPAVNRNYRSSGNMDVEHEQDEIEMQPLDKSAEVLVESSAKINSLPPQADETEFAQEPPQETESRELDDVPKGIFFMLFNWISPTMNNLYNSREKYEKDLEALEQYLEENIKKCLLKERAKTNHESWNRIEKKTPRGKLLSFVGWRLFWATLFHLLSIASSFATLVWALDHLFDFLAEVLNSGDRYQMDDIIELEDVTRIEAVPSRDKNKVLAAKWLQSFIICELIRACLTSITSIILIRTSIRVHQALSSAVYEKLFELTKLPGKPLSPLSYELKRISSSVQAFPYIVGNILSFVMAVVYSFKVLGFTYILTFAVFCIFGALHLGIHLKNTKLDKQRNFWKKAQYKILDTIFKNLRVFKLFSIEEKIKKHLLELKKEEMIHVFGITMFQMILMTLKMFPPLFLTVLCVLLVPAYFNQTVSLEHAFKLLIVNYWTVHLPKTFSHDVNLIQKSRNELENLKEMFSKTNEHLPKEIESPSNSNLALEFRWLKTSGRNDWIQIPKEKKVCIKGDEGDFPSEFISFLLLGRHKSGDSKNYCLRRCGSIAFMPETPWILNDTIKKNIVCENYTDEVRFKRAIKLSCLEACIKKHGDRIVDSDTLSAGEIHRISLARVLYSKADIYVLQELFSHLDSGTTNMIVEKLSIDKEFGTKTVIFNSKKDESFRLKIGKPQDSEIIIMFSGELILDEGEDSDDGLHSRSWGTKYSGRLQKTLPNDFVGRVDLSLSTTSNKSMSSQSAIKFQKSTKKSQTSFRKTETELKQVVTTNATGNPEETEPLNRQNLKRSSRNEMGSEVKQIWYIYVFHIVVAVLYQLGNFALHTKVEYWVYLVWFSSLLGSHIIIATLFSTHSKSRLIKFNQVFLDQFFQTSLTFLETKSHGRIRMMLSKGFSKVEISVLKNFNNILFRAIGALVSLAIITFILLQPSKEIWKLIFSETFQPKTVIATVIYLAAILYPIVVIVWLTMNFMRFKFCLQALLLAEQNFGSELDNYYLSTVSGHDIIHTNFYMKEFQAKKDECKEKRMMKAKKNFWWMRKFYELSDKYQGANWLLESMTHWWNIRVDLAVTFYVMFLWLCGVYFLEEFTEAKAALLVIFALIINYFLQFSFTYAFRFYLDIGSFEQISMHRRMMENDPNREENVLKEKDPEVENAFAIEQFKNGPICFDKVSLKYPNSGPNEYALNEVEFSIQPGEKVLINGSSGAGKTSIITALFQLFPLEESGNIEINNVMATDFNIFSYRSAMSIIPQKPILFFDTLRQTIDTDHKFSDDDIHDVLKEVGYNQDPNKDPNIETSDNSNENPLKFDLDTPWNENTPPTRKMIQVLFFAKAILDQKPVIVLDEFPTKLENVKKNTFRLIREKFEKKTVIFVTHLKRDRIVNDFSKSEDNSLKENEFRRIVIENGKVVSDSGQNAAANLVNSSSSWIDR